MYIIVGLGNPGKRYEGTRHNVGFDTVDVLARRHGIVLSKIKHKAVLGEGTIGGERVVLVKPQTFMNLSGESVQSVTNFYRIQPHELFVIYDDMDTAVGQVRIRKQGSAGSHNGMKSILYHYQDHTFPRFRIGIGNDRGHMNLADFVLSKFRPEEREPVALCIQNTADAVETALKMGIEQAMNQYNNKL